MDKFYPISVGGKITYVRHNMRQKTIGKIYADWSWRNGQYDARSFVEYINNNWWHRLLGRKAWIETK